MGSFLALLEHIVDIGTQSMESAPHPSCILDFYIGGPLDQMGRKKNYESSATFFSAGLQVILILSCLFIYLFIFHLFIFYFILFFLIYYFFSVL